MSASGEDQAQRHIHRAGALLDAADSFEDPTARLACAVQSIAHMMMQMTLEDLHLQTEMRTACQKETS